MRRRGSGRRRVELAVDSPVRPEAPPTPSVQPVLAALLGGAGVAVAGFLLALGVAAIAWLKAPDAVFSTLSHAATSVWLLAHGASAAIGGLPLGIMPLGLTGLVALLAGGASGFAANQRRTALRARHHGTDHGDELPSPGVESLRTAGLFTLAYLAALLLLGGIWGSGGQAIRALPGALVVVGLSALAGAMRAFGWRPWRTWPVWARALPAATASALLTLLVGSGVVTGIALAEHWHRVSALQSALRPGAGGGFVLFLLQLVYLPNLLVWGGSWMLGAGFAIGRGTMVTPVSTQLGFLPAIPVFGAVPSAGAHSQAHLLWLGVGVLAGALAALTVSLSRRRARFDAVALVGGLAGVVCALLFVLLAWLSGGPLGTQRLAVVGPRLWPLAVLGSTVLGLSGLLTGAVIGVLRPPHPHTRDDEDDADAGSGATRWDAALDERDHSEEAPDTHDATGATADAERPGAGRLRRLGGAHRHRPDRDDRPGREPGEPGAPQGDTFVGDQVASDHGSGAHATGDELFDQDLLAPEDFDRGGLDRGGLGQGSREPETTGRTEPRVPASGADDLLDGRDEATNPSIARAGSDDEDEPTRDIGRRPRRARREGPESR